VLFHMLQRTPARPTLSRQSHNKLP
jgi:hypothetical protein